MKKLVSIIFAALLLAATACAAGRGDGTSQDRNATSQGGTSVQKSTRIKITVKGRTLYAIFDDNATSRATSST